MTLYPDNIYHVFNRGINRQKIFYKKENYLRFLQKTRDLLFPICDILAFCLMPNHFHFLIYASEETIQPFVSSSPQKNNQIKMSVFSHGIKQLLSGYTKVINFQEKRTGSLFTQNTKAVQVSDDSILEDYALWCFVYIHQNPVKAGLVREPKNWEYSSYLDYAGLRNGTICNKKLASELLCFDQNIFPFMENQIIPEKGMKKLEIFST